MNKVFKTFHSGRAIFFLMVFICCIVGAVVLKLAASIILPFIIAILLALVMYPLIKLLDIIRCPRVISILLIVFIVVAGMFLFVIVLFESGRVIVDQVLQEDNIYAQRIQSVYDWMAETFNLPNDEEQSLWNSLMELPDVVNALQRMATSISIASFRFITSAVLMVIFLVFILVETNFLKLKITAAFENRIGNFDHMGKEIMRQVTRYLGAKFLFSLANGIIYAVGFARVGLEFAVVWGVVQFLLNFIPTLGSIAGGVIITSFALLQFWPDPTPVIIVLAIILGVNLILSNLLDPKIIGDHVGLSPLVILVSLSLWGYIWGFAGMVIAVPMTVIIKIVCEHIPILEPVSILIGSKRSVQKRKAESEKNETHP